MIKKALTNIFIFLIVFILIATAASLYYYNRVLVKEDKGQISYSADFRVFWFAAYYMRHHILKVWDRSKGYPTFRYFWFLSPKLCGEALPVAKKGQYPVYNKNEEFYHFRYSPFVAFIMMPLGRTIYPATALIIWYIILNIAFLATLLLIIKQINADFGLQREHRYFILWGTFLIGLRFYLLNISLGQTDILTTFLFTLFLMAYLRNLDIICGILLALIFQFKLFFFPLLIYFLFIRKIKIALSAVIGFLCFLFMPAYMLGFEKTVSLLHDWIEVLGLSLPSQILSDKNQSLVYGIGALFLNSSIVRQLFGSAKNFFYIISALLTLSACAVLAYFKKSHLPRDEKKFKYLEVSLLIIMSLVFSPIAWKAHFISLVIPFGTAVSFMLNSARRKIPYAALGIFIILSCLVGTDLLKIIPGLNEASLISVTLGAFFLAFALVYSYFNHRRTR